MSGKWHQTADKWNAAIQPGATIAYTRPDGTIWTDTVRSHQTSADSTGRMDVTESAVLDVYERGIIWRSHTGYLFKWAPWNSWLSKAPDSDEWVDLLIRTAIADERTPFVRVAT